jgi:hypothetical protein
MSEKNFEERPVETTVVKPVVDAKPAETEAVVPAKAGWSAGILSFAIKTCIVGVVIYTCAVFTTDAILESVNDTIHSVKSVRIGGAPFWEKIEHELDRAADPSSDLPPEKKQKIINDLRIIVARWRPVIEAIQGDTAKPAPTAASASAPAPQQ